MAQSIIIRTAREEDINRILELYHELAIITSEVEQGKHLSSEDYRETFARIRVVPGYHLLVADDRGIVVGTMVLLIMPNLAHNASPWAIIENLIVDSRYRGQQIGQLLIEHAIEKARESGCYKLILTSNKKRRAAHKFYRLLGFEASSYGFSLYFRSDCSLCKPLYSHYLGRTIYVM